jgi:phosphate transport system substrate-binding protein
MLGVVLGVGTAVFVAAGRADDTPKAERLNGSGASSIMPVMTRWAAAYKKAKGDEIDYTATGSGTGVKQMLDKKTDFACTDAPLNDEQLSEAKDNGGNVVHVPLVLGAVVPIYNVAGVNKPLNFTGPVLADIYMGKITKWNDPALAKLNPGAKLPDQEMAVTRRADASGTTFIFTHYLSRVSRDWNTQIGADAAPKWSAGTGAKGNAGVAEVVAKTAGAIGYVELAYALGQKDLQFGNVQNKDGRFVRADLESITAAAASLKDLPDDLRFALTNAPGKEAYPICGATWAVAYVKQPRDKARALADFLTWATHDGQKALKELHYAPLPKGLVERAEKKIALLQGE